MISGGSKVKTTALRFPAYGVECVCVCLCVCVCATESAKCVSVFAGFYPLEKGVDCVTPGPTCDLESSDHW